MPHPTPPSRPGRTAPAGGRRPARCRRPRAGRVQRRRLRRPPPPPSSAVEPLGRGIGRGIRRGHPEQSRCQGAYQSVIRQVLPLGRADHHRHGARLRASCYDTHGPHRHQRPRGRQTRPRSRSRYATAAHPAPGHAGGHLRARRPRGDPACDDPPAAAPGHVRRLRQAARRPDRAGHGQPAGTVRQRHQRHHLRGRAVPSPNRRRRRGLTRRDDPRRHPDLGRDQPGQQRRRAGQPLRRGHRHPDPGRRSTPSSAAARRRASVSRSRPTSPPTSPGRSSPTARSPTPTGPPRRRRRHR